MRYKGSEYKTSSFSNIDPVPFCVAVAQAEDGTVAVKHSQSDDPNKVLEFSRNEWIAFVKGVKAGEFDI